MAAVAEVLLTVAWRWRLVIRARVGGGGFTAGRRLDMEQGWWRLLVMEALTYTNKTLSNRRLTSRGGWVGLGSKLRLWIPNGMVGR